MKITLDIDNPFDAAALEICAQRDAGKSILAAVAKRIFFAGEVKFTSPAPAEKCGWKTVGELAALLGVGKRSIYQAIENGTLPHHRIGGSIRFAPEEVAAATARGI